MESPIIAKTIPRVEISITRVYNSAMENIIEKLNSIIENINTVKNKFGLTEDVEILAASKTRDLQTLQILADDERIKVFGENRVQEFMQKYTDTLTWDIIGRLQTNKVKYVVGKVRYIQSLDRISLADEIEKQAAKQNVIQCCLVEINTGAEEAKGGLPFEEVDDFVKTITEKYPHIVICGLMAVAPRGIGNERLRELFMSVRALYNKLKPLYNLTVLSMGMSEDYEIAVECGSTSVRLGRVLFGERV